MALQPNDAAAWISILRHHMDEMFNYIFHMKEQGGRCHDFSPHMDLFETADHFVAEIDLPGFAESDFSVNLTGSAIRVEGVKKLEKVDTAMSYICLERHFGRFSRSFEVPPGFDANRARARYERGVLSISVPRAKG